MAYQSYASSALTDIPANVAILAAAEGWTVDVTNPNEPIFTHPTLVGAVPMRMRANISGGNHDLYFERATSPASGPAALIRSPILSGGITQAPTTVHVFASQTPQPYIAVVVEYGFNRHRHLYFGYLEQVATHTGGEILAAANHEIIANDAQRSGYGAISHQYLCRGRNNRFGSNLQGGVHINHVNNANPWRQFRATGTYNGLEDFTGLEVFGGYMDGPNCGYLSTGMSPFLGGNILVPINLYMPMNPGATAYFAPLGRTPGVRMINMEDIEPGAQIDVGGNNWRCFPAARKSALTAANYNGSVIDYPIEETSYYIGYAYPE